MKKIILFSALLITAGLLQAQTIIPKAGITLSNWGGDDVSGTDSKLGWTLGVAANLPLGDGKLFSLQPELNVIQKGFSQKDGSASAKYRLNYLEIPFLAKFTFGDATKFYLNFGPSVAFGLGGKVKMKVGDEKADFDVNFGDEGEEGSFNIQKGTDIGLQTGAGFIFDNQIMLDVRYGLGLSSLYEDGDIFNNVLQFTIGVPFSLGGK